MIAFAVVAVSFFASSDDAYVAGPVELVVDGIQFSEGPLWLPSNELIFSDLAAGIIYNDDRSVFRKPSGQSNGLTLDPQGRLIACEGGNHRVTRTEADGKITVLAEAFEGKKFNLPNDVVVRSDGMILFTDPSYGLGTRKKELAFDGAFAITPKGEVKLLASDFKKPNGIALSLDEKTLYIADTEGANVRAFDLAADGTASNSRVVCELPNPDGMKVDSKGTLWCTAEDGVHVYTPEGKLLYTVKVPQQPANCAFGGADAKTLYITARTGVYRVALTTPGVLPGPKRE